MPSQQQGMKNDFVSPKPGSDELQDIVDAEDRVVGVRWRSQLYREEACNFRVINAFQKNREGKLWIP